MTTSQVGQAAAGQAAARNLPGLPMPKDLEMVFDPSRRPRAARDTRGRFPSPIPNGWFIVAASADIEGKLVLRDLPSCPVVDLPIRQTVSIQWVSRASDNTPTVLGPVDPDAFAPFAAARYG